MAVYVDVNVAVAVNVGVFVGVLVRVGVPVRGLKVIVMVGVGVTVKVSVRVAVMVTVKVKVGEPVVVADAGVGVLKFRGVRVGVKKRRANASAVNTWSVLVGVAVSNPVFGMMRSGSMIVGWLMRATMKGRLNERLHAASTTTMTANPLFCFLSKSFLLSLNFDI